MIYDWPTDADWRRGTMRSAVPGKQNRPPWDFIHDGAACRWPTCEYHEAQWAGDPTGGKNA